MPKAAEKTISILPNIMPSPPRFNLYSTAVRAFHGCKRPEHQPRDAYKYNVYLY